jgi:hypothetical protein
MARSSTSFHKGQIGNPSGSNLHRDKNGWQPFAKRVKTHFANMSEEQILELAANTKKLSMNDALIVKQLAEGLLPGDNRFVAAEKIFDRADGKATENINGIFDITTKADLGDAPLDERQLDALRTLLTASTERRETDS